MTYNSETALHGIHHQKASRYEKTIVFGNDVFGRFFNVLFETKEKQLTIQLDAIISMAP